MFWVTQTNSREQLKNLDSIGNIIFKYLLNKNVTYYQRAYTLLDIIKRCSFFLIYVESFNRLIKKKIRIGLLFKKLCVVIRSKLVSALSGVSSVHLYGSFFLNLYRINIRVDLYIVSNKKNIIGLGLLSKYEYFVSGSIYILLLTTYNKIRVDLLKTTGFTYAKKYIRSILLVCLYFYGRFINQLCR